MANAYTRTSLKNCRLRNGQRVHCVNRLETKLIDQHVRGYFELGIDYTQLGTVIDAGANIGLFALEVLARSERANVYAFEPVPELYAALAANAADAPNRLRTYRQALWSHPGEIDMIYLPRATMLSSTGSLFWNERSSALEGIFVKQLRRAPSELAWTRVLPAPVIHSWARSLLNKTITRTCRAVSISDVINEHGINHVDLLKVDCEGAEESILEGIAPQHWARIDRVVAEVHDLGTGRLGRMFSLLKKRGYEVAVEEEQSLAGTGLFTVLAIRA